MCGILGVGGPRGRELVSRLLPELRHRGPDDEGSWCSPELTLGHRRLAIIGLDEGGRQPMVSVSGRSVITFNGEIYNYLEIAGRLESEGRRVNRRYDTAVLLEALELWGAGILPELNGMFAFAWYRPGEGSLLLARDRWGKKPLFWGTVRLDDGTSALAVASELRLFRRLPGGPPPPDGLGVLRYLVYDGLPGSRTVYRGVFKVPPASWVEVGPDGALRREGCYWEPRLDPHPIEEAEAEKKLASLLEQSVRLRLRSDVPVGLFLSGGMDSSLLAATWRKVAQAGTVRTFTVGFDDPSYDESGSARLMADAVGAEHHEIIIGGRALEEELDFVWDHLSEPFADPSIVPTSLLCRFARQHVKVAIGGDGGDELQAGYDPFRAWRTARWMESLLPRAIWRRALRAAERLAPADGSNLSLKFKLHHFAQGFLHPPAERIQGWMASFPLPLALAAVRPELLQGVDPAEVIAPTRDAFLASRGAGELQAQIHAWLRTYLECCILTKVDRASMMHGLEVRAPYLDPDLASFLLSLQSDLIFRHGRGKVLMRRAAESLLPAPLLCKGKKGFGVPQTSWLRTVLRERMEQAIAASGQGGWFRAEVVEGLWREHRAGHYDFRRALWSFLFAHPFQSN